MIKEKTVFVFGAGLSSDYYFPTGKGLRDDIVKYISWDRGAPDLPAQIKRLVNLGFDVETIIRTREAIRRGGFNTIDEFMEIRPELRPLTVVFIDLFLIK